MFSHASNFRIDGQPTFVNQASSQYTNHDNIEISVSDVLKCPAPSQYFVGRADMLSKLAKVFSAPVVTIFNPDPDKLARFVRYFSKRPTIYIDATSEEALTNALAENPQDFECIYSDTILVLENAHASLELDDHFPVCFECPILVTSTDSTLSNIASSFAHAFRLPTNSSNKSVMAKFWTEIQRALTPGQRIVSLVASGGTGKTRTVSKFIQDNSCRFAYIWFFDATSKETLTSDFKELARAVGVGDRIKDLYLKDYLPICAHGNIIITSRLVRTSEMDSPGCHIGFSDLNKDDAMELLLKCAHEESHEKTQDVTSKIVEALGCQALAVSTAGAYIHTNATCTLENYLACFNNKRRDILNYRLRALDNYQRTVFSAFQLSFEKLSLPSHGLIQMCAYLHPTAIPLEMFTRATAFVRGDTYPGETKPSNGIDILDKLMGLFAQEGTQRMIGFHSVLHACARESVEDIKNQRKVIGEHHLDTLRAMGNVASTYRALGKLESAQKLGEEVLVLYKKVIGEHHPNTLDAMSSLMTYHDLGRLESAQQLEGDIRKSTLGSSEFKVCSSLSSCKASTWAPQVTPVTPGQLRLRIYKINVLLINVFKKPIQIKGIQ
ncbi:hypothetical protein BDP27DRAFT_1479731 [Rhodocollybia butyracea]|uniref:Uncharacterized protein n=1 Tax=Rhodocollybia butyracea TaxID=206335 RepID=A0A9P5PH93_9AGAR|nr:hypothetical protein BDP27DRAFT_1479731 [Rhodocollybia butyracea]